MIPTHTVHASSPLSFISIANNNGCGASTCTIGGVSAASGDLFIVTYFSGAGCTPTETMASTPTETWTETQSFGGGYEIWSATAHSTSAYSFTQTCTSSTSGVMSVNQFRGTFNGFGSAIVNTGGSAASGTDSFNMNVQPGSIIFEGFVIFGTTCGSISSNSGQVQRYNNCDAGTGKIDYSIFNTGPTVGSGTISLSVSWGSCGNNNCQIRHSGLELTSVVPSGSVGTTNACYGVCGNPPVTLSNPNATHTINFNNSQTIFYEAQSNLNGFVQNVSTSLAKSYTNGMIVTLALYLTNVQCAPQQSPFTSQCPGILQSSQGFLNPSKGKLTVALQTPVQIGQWLGIAVSGNINGLDLNETNGTCGTTGGVNCASPPGMVFTNGVAPSIITTTGTLNVASISTTALWSWIFASITSQIPPPPIATPCINSDLSCFMIASACGLTPSNCFIGGAVIFFIYYIVFVIGITLCISYINREYSTQIHFPPAIFFLFFLVELFMFTAMGLVPQYVTIVIFLLTALGVAGFFGSGFVGGSHKE